VQNCFGERGETKRKRRDEEKRRVREGEVCRTLLSINPKVRVGLAFSNNGLYNSEKGFNLVVVVRFDVIKIKVIFHS